MPGSSSATRMRAMWDLEAEECTTIGCVVDGDRAVMQLDDTSGDCKAETGPLRLAGKEGLEDLVSVCGRNAGSVIANLDHEPPALLRDAHRDRFAGGAGVVDEVHEHLAHAFGVERPR